MSRTQDTQIVAALCDASRLGWAIEIGEGRGVVAVTAKRKALYPGTRATEYDQTGITIARSSLKDALAHVLQVVTLDSTPLEGDPEHERIGNHLRDERQELRP